MGGIPSSLEDLAGKQVLSLLLALLPGLIASEIIYTLTVREKRDVVDRVINALVHTFAIYVVWQGAIVLRNLCVAAVSMSLYGAGSRPWIPTASASLIGLGVCSVCWGLLCTFAVNTDCIHSSLKRLGITASSSHPSQWYTAFYSTRGRRYVVVHLKDGRRIFGWPKLWSNDPKEGHLYVTGAEWLDLDKDQSSHPRSDMLIDVADVSYIEFVPLEEENRTANGQQITEKESAVQQATPGGEKQGGSELRRTGGPKADATTGTAQANKLHPKVGEVRSE